VRALIALLILAGCHGKPCRALPLPSTSVFESCGGVVYHAPPGSSTEYTIRFVDKMSADFELVDMCVLLDGSPIFTGSEVKEAVANAGKHPAVWKGKLASVRHEINVQVIYKPRGDMPGLDVTKKYEFKIRAAQEIAASDGAELELIAFDRGKESPLDERPAIRATLPSNASQPRCE
jgi:hypothetical protein